MPKRGAEPVKSSVKETTPASQPTLDEAEPTVEEEQSQLEEAGTGTEPEPEQGSDESPEPAPASPRTLTRTPRGMLIVLSGAPGLGKSSLAAEFPGPIQLMIDENDQGILDLIDLGRIPGDKFIQPDASGISGCPIITNDKAGYNTWWRYMELLDEAITVQREKHGGAPPPYGHEWNYIKAGHKMRMRMPNTILSESLTGFETSVIHTVVANDLKGNWDDAMNFGGSKWSSKAEAKEWPRTLRRINSLRSHGIIWIMTCHTEVVSDDSEIADMKVRRQKCHKRTINVWQKDANCSAMIALDVEYQTVTENKKTGAMTGKAKREARKKLVCYESPVYLNCKNHFGITGDIILPTGPRASYEAWCKAGKLDPATFRPRGR